MHDVMYEAFKEEHYDTVRGVLIDSRMYTDDELPQRRERKQPETWKLGAQVTRKR